MGNSTTPRPGRTWRFYDRVGGGDSFASGLIYGLMEGKSPEQAVNYGAAHGALAMTTPGDTTTATLKEVEKAMKGAGATGGTIDSESNRTDEHGLRTRRIT